MRNILAPVDLSEVSQAVIERASCFVQSPASKIWLLHVVPPFNNYPPFNLDYSLWRRETAKALRSQRQQLRALAEQLRSEHNHVFTRFIAGTVSKVIVAEAERLRVDLIVMGSHGHGNVYHALLGDVGQKVMRKAPCPVMFVQPVTSKPHWHQASQAAGAEGQAYRK